MRPVLRGNGWQPFTFECSYDDADRVQRKLATYAAVEAISFSAGAVRARIDLSRLEAGGGPAFALMVKRVLEAVVARHEMTTDRPPPAEPDEVA